MKVKAVNPARRVMGEVLEAPNIGEVLGAGRRNKRRKSGLVASEVKLPPKSFSSHNLFGFSVCDVCRALACGLQWLPPSPDGKVFYIGN